MMLTRRELMQSAILSSIATFLPPSLLQAIENAEDDHFLVLYLMNGGIDNHYWFDPKSKALTAAQQKQNYLEGRDEEIMLPITDARGMQSFCTPLVKDLWTKHKDLFSVLKGVYMSRSSDGHENNLTMLLSGTALTSESFLHQLPNKDLLSFVESGFAKDFVTNTGGGANLSPTLMTNLVKQVKASSAGNALGEDFIQERLRLAGSNKLFGTGSNGVLDGLMKRSVTSKVLAGFKVDEYGQYLQESPQVQFLPVMRDCFVNKLSSVAIIRDGGLPPVDVHSNVEAKKVAKRSYPGMIANLDRMFQFLKDTPYDGSRKLSDVCTVVVASEFNRTYRSLAVGGVDVNNTGTDHNTFSNFVLIGGKGVKTGLICGETDLSEVGADNQFKNVAQAHKEIDPFLVKSIGLPFDFDNLVAQPFKEGASFNVRHHLTYNSVINTVLKLFGATGKVTIENTSTVAKTLDKILA